MTEIFGNRADFAIEAGVEPALEIPSAVWGHMCIWCRGIPLGDITNSFCGLYGSYLGFQWLISNVDGLWAPELAGHDVSDWNFLDGLLYGYHGDVEVPDDRTVEQCRADWEKWGGFDLLTNWGEQFDGYKSFIFSPPGGSIRILSRRLPKEMGLRVEVSRSAFIEASGGFIRWFETEELRLGEQGK